MKNLNTSKFFKMLLCVCVIFYSFSVSARPQVESRTRGHHNANAQPHYSDQTQNAAQEPFIPVSAEPSTVPSHAHVGNAEDRAALLTLKEMEFLRKEVSELRGIIEMQDHEIKQLKKSQQDFYMDLDRRLSQLKEGKEGNVKKGAAAKDEKISKNEKEKNPKSPKIAEKNEQSLYQEAYTFVKNKQYDEAMKAFQHYLQEFPKGEHTANAQYWLGEIYSVEWQADKNNPALLDKAYSAFSTITKEYPNHTKTADATLKLGLIELNRGNLQEAKQFFKDVQSRYPGTTAAKLAQTRLEHIP